jgi:L-2-hydroxyglutarate oxidase LhgO
LPIIRPERAAFSGETGLLAALEDAFAAAKILIPRADLRAVVQAGAIRLKPLLQALAQKATPKALDAGATGVKLTGAGGPAADFMIEWPRHHGLPRVVHLFGIESPGLTCALSLVEDVADYLSA